MKIKIHSFISRGSNPVVISAPADLKGMSLEERLRTYDWQSQFRSFQKVTQKGSFKVHCVGAKDNSIMVSFSIIALWLLINKIE